MALIRKTVSIPAWTIAVFSAFLLFSCASEPENNETTAIQIDSAFAAQEKAKADTTGRSRMDTARVNDLPPVMEGDLIFQISKNDRAKALQLASGSKYSNVGLIFTNPRDGQYMVVDALDSIHASTLDEWIRSSEGSHVAILRMKNSNKILGASKTKKLKQKVKELKGVPYDPYFSWGNDALYSSEFVWKLYSKVLYIDICEPGKLNSFDLSSGLVKKQIGDKYAKGISDTLKAVSPGDLYRSPKLDIIYEH